MRRARNARHKCKSWHPQHHGTGGDQADDLWPQTIVAFVADGRSALDKCRRKPALRSISRGLLVREDATRAPEHTDQPTQPVYRRHSSGSCNCRRCGRPGRSSRFGQHPAGIAIFGAWRMPMMPCSPMIIDVGALVDQHAGKFGPLSSNKYLAELDLGAALLR